MEKIKNIILKYKTYIICLIIIILSIISIIFQNIDRKNLEEVNKKENTENGEIAVYITGAVKNPGVYYIKENSRLSHLLDIFVVSTASSNALRTDLTSPLELVAKNSNTPSSISKL